MTFVEKTNRMMRLTIRIYSLEKVAVEYRA